ncbi:homeodomain-interacting protein kinase 2-like [Pempheris klunzingeri]|uniref:homeodomain-interacting protein kinase 2-like n=1 Tax=Pempheris klunzingeri TaxID=3127111 RepID=UPI00397F01C0
MVENNRQSSTIFTSKSTWYRLLNHEGEGSYGKVAKCVDMKTKKLVAVKTLYNKDAYRWELEMLTAIRALDPEKTNIVRFIEGFPHHDLSCLAFEILDRSLWDLLCKATTRLNLNEIRYVMQQLFVALDALKGIGIVHADIKPDNIMLVNHGDQPFRVKLIDFGLARPVSNLYTGMTIQNPSYRAPELTLGLPLSEAVDMWSVGCIMSFLYFGGDFFDGDCDYHRMKAMIHMLGQPEDLLLSAGKFTWSFFSREDDSSGPGWRLKSPEEYKKATGKMPDVKWGFFQKKGNLEYIVKNFPNKASGLEYEDRMAFLSLLKSILHMDPEKRITPREALAHPFITMANLAETSSYSNAGLQLMTVTLSHSLDKTDNPVSDTEDHTDDQASDSRAGASDTHTSNYEEADLGALKVSSDREPSSARLSVNDNTSILHMDAGKRITPREALAHPVIIMANLSETSLYSSADLTDDDNAPLLHMDAAPRRRNLFQRTLNLFRRVKTRVVSIFK